MDKLIVVKRSEKDQNDSYKLGWLIGTIKGILQSGDIPETEYRALCKNLLIIMRDNDKSIQEIIDISKDKGYEIYHH